MAFVTVARLPELTEGQGVCVQAGGVVTFTPKDPRQALRPAQKVPVKFEVKGDTAAPTGCAINGSPCG